jgi:hypothetical protein
LGSTLALLHPNPQGRQMPAHGIRGLIQDLSPVRQEKRAGAAPHLPQRLDHVGCDHGLASARRKMEQQAPRSLLSVASEHRGHGSLLVGPQPE